MNQTDLSKLYKASHKDNVKVVTAMLRKLNRKLPAEKDWLDPALFAAVRYGKSLAVFELLVAAGANLSAKYYDETLLMAAAGGGYLPIVKRKGVSQTYC